MTSLDRFLFWWCMTLGTGCILMGAVETVRAVTR